MRGARLMSDVSPLPNLIWSCTIKYWWAVTLAIPLIPAILLLSQKWPTFCAGHVSAAGITGGANGADVVLVDGSDSITPAQADRKNTNPKMLPPPNLRSAKSAITELVVLLR